MKKRRRGSKSRRKPGLLRTIRKKIERLRGRQVVHFIHVRKTGGTAIKEALLPRIKSGPYRIKLHQHVFSLRQVPRGEKAFFFLRDPIARFVSGYCSRMRQGQPRYFFKWTAREEAAFKEFDTPNKLALAIESADPDVRKRARRAMRGIRHVRTSFKDWLKNKRYFRSRLEDVFFIGFQETLARDFDQLKMKLGLPESVTLPDDDVRAHRNTLAIDTRLDEQARENLRNWYKRDYEFFELCKSVADDVNSGKAPRLTKRRKAGPV